MINNALHTSTVWVGFIPVLPAAGKILNKFPAIARSEKVVAYG